MLLNSFVLPVSYENTSLFGDVGLRFEGQELRNVVDHAADGGEVSRQHLLWRLLQRGNSFVMSDLQRDRRHRDDFSLSYVDAKQVAGGGEHQGAVRVLVYVDPHEPLAPSLFHTIVYAAQQHSEKWYSPRKYLGGAGRVSSSLEVVVMTQQPEGLQVVQSGDRAMLTGADLAHCMQLLTRVGVSGCAEMCTGQRGGLYVIPIPEEYWRTESRVGNSTFTSTTISSYAGKKGTVQRHRREDVSVTLLREAAQRKFQLSVRRVLDSADADLLVIPRKRCVR